MKSVTLTPKQEDVLKAIAKEKNDLSTLFQMAQQKEAILVDLVIESAGITEKPTNVEYKPGQAGSQGSLVFTFATADKPPKKSRSKSPAPADKQP
jgi:hypothetical protein